jgi:hypothetical protein
MMQHDRSRAPLTPQSGKVRRSRDTLQLMENGSRQRPGLWGFEGASLIPAEPRRGLSTSGSADLVAYLPGGAQYGHGCPPPHAGRSISAKISLRDDSEGYQELGCGERAASNNRDDVRPIACFPVRRPGMRREQNGGRAHA